VQTYTTDSLIGMTEDARVNQTHRRVSISSTLEPSKIEGKNEANADKTVAGIANTVSRVLLHEDLAKHKVNQDVCESKPLESKWMGTERLHTHYGRCIFMNIRQPTATNVCEFITYALQPGLRTHTRLNSFKDIWKAVSSRVQPWLTQGNIKGIKIACAGRLQGAELAYTQTRKLGKTSVHRFSDKLEYAFAKANTQYGAIGVRVWVQTA